MAPSPPTPPQPQAFATAAARTEQSEIQQTLGQYRTAYQRLDAQAARTVWPSVDARALGRAFSTLASQQLSFDSCLVDIAGNSATAHCTGSATYTPKVGGGEPRSELRQWTFQLRKASDGWKIQSAQIRRDN
jgi:ketosteroid isomerase-like protein